MASDEPLRRDRPYEQTKAGLRLFVRVNPRARRAGLEGLARDAEGRPFLSIKLNAPPVDGAANAALIALVAKALGVPKSSIAISVGRAARAKIVDIAGDAALLAEKLDAWRRES